MAQSPVQLVYLTLSNPQFHILWPQLCARAKNLWAKYASYMPAGEILNDWFGKLRNPTPLSQLLIGLLVEDESRIIGHFIVTANFYYGQGFVEIHQLQLDRPGLARQFKKAGVQGIIDWMQANNQILEDNNVSVRFDTVRFLTPHNPKFWQRWLGSLMDYQMTEHTLTFSLKEAS